MPSPDIHTLSERDLQVLRSPVLMWHKPPFDHRPKRAG